MARNDSARGSAPHWTAAMVLGVCAAFALGACDNALEIDTPGQVPAENLQSPEFAALLVNGVIADFECALGSFIVNGALISGELLDATFTANRWPVPSRSVQPGDVRYSTFSCSALGLYTPASTARWSADNILAKLQEWTDAEVENRQQLIATAAAYSGYSHLLLAEAFCSCAIDLSAELSSSDVFALAEEKFSLAISAAQAVGDDELLNMALVGRARARLHLGKTAEAVADARLVPDGFVKYASASNASERRNNRVADETDGENVSVGETYRNLTVDGAPDSRVEVVDTGGVGNDAQTPLFVQTKYPDQATPTPIASWDEAQLIIAEVEGGDEAVGIINDLRARAGLPATFSSTDEAVIQAQVIEARRRELFLEGQRLYDVRRFDLPLMPAPGTPYPKGGVYGDAKCLPLPDVERASNPNL